MFGVFIKRRIIMCCIILIKCYFRKTYGSKRWNTSLGESVVPKEAMGSSASSNESTAITNDSSLGVAGIDIKNIKKSLLRVTLEWDLLQCLQQH